MLQTLRGGFHTVSVVGFRGEEEEGEEEAKQRKEASWVEEHKEMKRDQ